MDNLWIGNFNIGIVKKSVKNMYIRVLPPDGKVIITVPENLNDDAMRMFALSKLPWIKTQKQKFEEQPRQTKREYITGESYYVWGRRYRLDVRNSHKKNNIFLAGDKLVLEVVEGLSAQQRGSILNKWYRHNLKSVIPEVLEKCEKVVGVKAAECCIKNMRTKWGTCNIAKRRIWLNLQLAKKTPECLEYVIIHELVHLLEKNHNDNFYKYMDLYCPNWRVIKDHLNQQMLDYYYDD